MKHIKRYGVHGLHRYRHRGHVPLLALGVMRVNGTTGTRLTLQLHCFVQSVTLHAMVNFFQMFFHTGSGLWYSATKPCTSGVETHHHPLRTSLLSTNLTPSWQFPFKASCHIFL